MTTRWSTTHKRRHSVPQLSFLLLGPRGSGRRTWLRANFPDAYVVDLLSEAHYQRLLAQPGRWVVVDKIQRLPALLNEVHRLGEER